MKSSQSLSNTALAITCVAAASMVCCSAAAAESGSIVIESRRIHVRSDGPPEWAWFANQPDCNAFRREFHATSSDRPTTLTLDQENVKQTWEVRLNETVLGKLVRDENATQADFVVPAGTLVDGTNTLRIHQLGSDPDDVRIGNVTLHRTAPKHLRNQARVSITVTDTAGNAMPARITIINEAGVLIPVAAPSEEHLAVREGVVYTATGDVTLGLAAGRYRITAGRGFEYSVETKDLEVVSGDTVTMELTLTRPVDTTGWVACDTHVHTVTHSGHGDCTDVERMVTLCGEGVELPIATDHNVAIDYRPLSERVGTSQYFTPLVGDELTTPKGHFNLFPLRLAADLPDHRLRDWNALFDQIDRLPDCRVAILNHGRDIHSGYRPLDPAHHISLTAERLDERPIRFNAMEICNSGAVLTEPTRLFRDWCGLINRGHRITPVGCSDSHDVTRYIVGQGRTYIRCDDHRVGQLNTPKAIQSFLAGRVVVSYGLFVELTVDGMYQVGDSITPANNASEIVVTAVVRGPEWAAADAVSLMVNGHKRFETKIDKASEAKPGVLGRATWRLPLSKLPHDVWISAFTIGPGIDEPFWKTALPYQPTSKSFTPYCFSSTGPIWIDADRDGTYQSPHQIAQAIVMRSGGDRTMLLESLERCDRSVIQQAAAILRISDGDLDEDSSLSARAAADGTPLDEVLFEYRQAYRDSMVKRLEDGS